MNIFWTILQLIVTAPFWFPAVLWLVGSIAKIFKRTGSEKVVEKPALDVGVIVTAFQQTDLLPDVVNSLLASDYHNFVIYIVADDCDISNLHFTSEKVCLLRPEVKLASNTKSHFYAINHFLRDHEVITIIDSDNIVDPQYLASVVSKINEGYDAVQGVRAARNLNTVYACLDEAGDMLYRFIDRKLLYEAGSSASLAGSGMAFKTRVFVALLEQFDISGAGFDKYLQYELVNKNKRIAFSMSAVVYDGKTTAADQLVKQRARWINTWFKYWSLAISLFLKSIIRLNWNQFAFSIMLLRPPLFILTFCSFVFLVINIFFAPELLIIWAVALFCFIVMFGLALKTFGADKRIYRALVQVPRFIFYQVVALFKARNANRISVATQHDVSAYKKENYETDRN